MSNNNKLSSVQVYAVTVKADRKAAAVARRAEVAARKMQALDSLVAEIQG